MASKTSTKCKCKYVFIQGPKKGTVCKRNCRNDYCKEHNKKKKEYQKKYYDTNVKKSVDLVLYEKEAKIKSINNVDRVKKILTRLQLSVADLRSNISGRRALISKVRGIDISTEKLTEEDLDKKLDELYKNGKIRYAYIAKDYYVKYEGNNPESDRKKLLNEIEKKKAMIQQKNKLIEICKARIEKLETIMTNNEIVEV